jgi:polysaccharide biosynthesis transport protein
MDGMEEQSSFNVEQIWGLARRGRWWILLPLFLCWAIIWGVGWLLPTTYESEALILIEQQKVPEQYVLSNVSVNLEERLQSMTQQILSRSRLQSIIDRFHLYQPAHGIGKFFQSGDPVEQMRKDIKIELVEQTPTPGKPADLTAFKIQYGAGSPELAQQVNNMLTEQFIDESLNAQRQMSESTTSFLDNQLDQAAKTLQEQEKTVRAFKTNHLGDLPSQLQTNVQILSGLQVEQQNVQHAIDVAKQQRLYLESQLQQLQSVQGTLGEAGGPSPLESLQKQLLEQRARLADERSGHTEDYPDIVALKAKIAETEKLIKDIASNSGAKDSKDGSTSNASSETALSITSSPLMQIRSQLKANDAEIADYQKQARTIDQKITEYRSRLNLTPETEQQLAEISRGYEESKANYDSLLLKKDQSQLATNLEQRQGGEQFRILDPPSFPDKPKSPNHLFLSLGGLGCGIVLGIGLVAMRELTSARVNHEDDLDGIVPGRVLVRIPHLDTPREIRRRRASRLLEAVAVLAMAVLIVAGNLYSFFKG